MTAGAISPSDNRKRAALLFYAALTMLLITYWSTLLSMVEIWSRSGTFTHGFLIAPISLWLIWRKKSQLENIQISPQVNTIILLAGIVFIWLLGHLADVQVVMQFAFIAMIPVLIWAFFGKNIVKAIAFPLAFLFFTVPAGEFMIPFLQDITASFTVNALRLTGIPVYWVGHYFNIPSGSFEIAVACSGVRYLIASLALGTLYAYLTYRSFIRRVLFIAVSLVVPVLANGIRAYGIVMLAHLSDYKLATGVDHLIYGWLFFGVVIMLMFWIGSYFREDGEFRNQSDINTMTREIRPESSGLDVLLLMLAASVLIAGPASGYWLDTRAKNQDFRDISLPAAVNGWAGPYKADINWQPEYLGAYQEITGLYKWKGRDVQIYMAYYTQQHQGGEMVNATNKLYSGAWHKIRDDFIKSKNGTPMRELVITSPKNTTYLRQWYLIDGEPVVSSIWAKIYEARSRILLRNKGSYAIELGVNSVSEDDKPDETIDAFLDQMWPLIRRSLLASHA